MPRKPRPRLKDNPDLQSMAAAALADFPRGSRFLLAVSGGADSTAMLAALAPAALERGWVLRCFHVEHGIRPAPESRGDAEAVKDLASRFKVPWRVCHIPPGRIAGAARRWGSGIEAAARRFRRRAWNRERRRIGARRILVAHTRDDLLENVLMAFLRGAGPSGLAAMPPSRGAIVRPLLGAGRSQIESWLACRGLSYRRDSTNADTGLLRNRVRLLLVPQLDRYFPAWRGAALKLAETQGLAAGFLVEEAARLLPWAEAGGALATGRGAFFAAPPILREEALFRGADLLGARKPPARTEPDISPGRGGRPRREALRRFAAGGLKALDLGPLRGEIRGERVVLSPPPGGGERGFSGLIKEPGLYTLMGLTLVVRGESAGPDSGAPESGAAFQAELPLVLRSPLPGEGGPLLARQRFLGYTEFITVCDRLGVAALIGVGPGKADVLVRREGERGENAGFFTVLITLG